MKSTHWLKAKIRSANQRAGVDITLLSVIFILRAHILEASKHSCHLGPESPDGKNWKRIGHSFISVVSVQNYLTSAIFNGMLNMIKFQS